MSGESCLLGDLTSRYVILSDTRVKATPGLDDPCVIPALLCSMVPSYTTWCFRLNNGRSRDTVSSLNMVSHNSAMGR